MVVVRLPGGGGAIVCLLMVEVHYISLEELRDRFTAQAGSILDLI